MTCRVRVVIWSSAGASCIDCRASSCSRLVRATATSTKITTEIGTSTLVVSWPPATTALTVVYTSTPTISPRQCQTSGLSRNRCNRGDWAVAANCTTRNSKAKTTLVSASRPGGHTGHQGDRLDARDPGAEVDGRDQQTEGNAAHDVQELDEPGPQRPSAPQRLHQRPTPTARR